MNIEMAKQMDMVDYLLTLGYNPTRISKEDHWYLSPLREEKTASFKVNRKQNVWYDHGLGKGGTIIDFGTLYYHCTVSELLQKLKSGNEVISSFHPLEQRSIAANKIQILSSTEITDPTLRNYLHSRKIPLVIANQFCSQVAFEINNKKHLAIGFQNNSGGYELRNYYFKGSSSPKEPKLILQKKSNDLLVFEGFFNFLSYQTIFQTNNKTLPELSILQANSLVLNSVAFFEKSREFMEKFQQVSLYLDNDKMGKLCSQKALQWSEKYKDQSNIYKGVKDLNDFLVNPSSLLVKRRGNYRGIGL